ncbi:hypothetical protein HG537_0H01580 [Torulaspora globosa]|uniref:Uncharacterized protein n=1 Tax=Torulaspora globosa TaxID=48254 RepID=A0A7H9I0N7_9SACH|nr:hypothetical protein HG537_0H01580 [Torulaspora sp. CBS 2947]
MAYKRPTLELQDITNVMEQSTDLSHQSNVFKRLSTSPTKAYPDDISKPAMRLSPVKRSPNKIRTQMTPKRLVSPECLKNYIPRITQSMDRPHFNREERVQKYEEDGSVTNLVFPSSPTKMAFRSDKKIGGDGSLSKLRSRFSNGLLSPQRFANGTSSRFQGTNLFSKLEEEAEEAEKDSERMLNFKRELAHTQDHSKISKKRLQKTVKFQIPATDGESDMTARVNYLELTLSQVLKRQKELEDRLMMMEQRTRQDEGS